MEDEPLEYVDSIAALEALARLLAIAQRDTGQAWRVASFLLAWHNAEENGGWGPVDLRQMDTASCADMLLVLHGYFCPTPRNSLISRKNR